MIFVHTSKCFWLGLVIRGIGFTSSLEILLFNYTFVRTNAVIIIVIFLTQD